jgi:hypothetical protein
MIATEMFVGAGGEPLIVSDEPCGFVGRFLCSSLQDVDYLSSFRIQVRLVSTGRAPFARYDGESMRAVLTPSTAILSSYNEELDDDALSEPTKIPLEDFVAIFLAWDKFMRDWDTERGGRPYKVTAPTADQAAWARSFLDLIEPYARSRRFDPSFRAMLQSLYRPVSPCLVDALVGMVWAFSDAIRDCQPESDRDDIEAFTYCPRTFFNIADEIVLALREFIAERGETV